MAEAAFEHSADIVISGSNQSKLDTTVARLREAYPSQCEKQSIITHVCDLADVANLDINLEALFQAAINNGATKLNHVVTTAGDALQIPTLSDTNPQSIYNLMNVRLIAAAIMAKYISKYVESSPASSFTLTSGVLSHKPAPGYSLVAALGSALEGLARGLAVDLKPIRVNVVSPGAVHTESFSQFPRDALDSILQKFREQSTTGTVGRPEDVAESYIYIMKDQFVSGTVIHSNGGALLA